MAMSSENSTSMTVMACAAISRLTVRKLPSVAFEHKTVFPPARANLNGLPTLLNHAGLLASP